MKTPEGRPRSMLGCSATILALAISAWGEEKPIAMSTPDAGTNSLAQMFTEAFTKGKLNLNARLRYEYVDQAPTYPKDSDAFTLRTRLGFTTAPLSGFQGMLEFENTTAIPNDNHYNAAGSNDENNRPVIADPQATEVNQAWLSYSSFMSTARAGRERIVLDNHRFIGDVGWRQNMQTYDGATISSTPLTHLNLFYGFVTHVNRVFGDVNDLPPANTDFDSSSHLANASYTLSPLAKLTAYTYLLDLQNKAGDANSCASYGLSLTGTWTFATNRNGRLNYRAEYAYQTDYAHQPADYSASYLRAEATADYDIWNLGLGYELLDSGANANGGSRIGFKTPLATLHAFNGWADAFLNTPADGLQDFFVSAGVRLPGRIPLSFTYHTFTAAHGGATYGQECDAMASFSFAKYLTALIKYAYFDGQDAPTAYDAHKFWAQLEFNY